MWRWGALIAVFWTASVGGMTPTAELAVGQEWSIKGVPESTAKVIIGRIEPWNNKIAIHVSIVDIPPPRQSSALHISQVAHAPFEKSVLMASLDRLLAIGVAPSQDFEAGYKQWKDHHGGIYTISVAQALGLTHAIDVDSK